MLPADFAFGTTKLVNDPINTISGMPRDFVNLGGKIGADVYNVGANPSVNTVFNIMEDTLGVLGVTKGGVVLYRTGAGLIPQTGAAAEASSWQGKGNYPGVDNWVNVTLHEGDVVYAGAPGNSPFFTTAEAVANSGGDAATLFQGLQVAAHPQFGYYPGVTVYMITEETPAAMSTASANPQHGTGGSPQYFIPNPKTRVPVISIPLK